MRFNAEAKERLSREQSNSFDLSNQLEKSQADLLTIVDITENLEVTNANNVAEAKRIAHDKFEVETRLNEVAALLVKANTRISALESHLNSSETERDTEINKVQICFLRIQIMMPMCRCSCLRLWSPLVILSYIKSCYAIP